MLNTLSRLWRSPRPEPLFSQDTRARYYVHGGNQQIKGWLSSFSLSFIKIISDFQAKKRVSGHVAEIGVLHGRYFIGLALLLNQGERAFAVDVFDLQEFNLDNSGEGDLEQFTKNMKTFLGTLEPVTIIKQDSKTVAPEQLMAPDNPSRRVRIFSVDGCHTRAHTESDISLASAALCDGGVIIVDDFRNPDWPEVAPGVEDFLRGHPRFKPFAFSCNKLYLCHERHHRQYACLFKKITTAQARPLEWTEVMGTRTIQAVGPIPESLFTGAFACFIDYSGGRPPRHLTSGWHSPEKWGVWSNGAQEATLTIPITGKLRAASHGTVCFHAFTHQEKLPALEIDIAVQGTHRETVTFPFGADYITWKFAMTEADKSMDRLRLSFTPRRAASPVSLGLSPDDRILGVGLRAVYFL